MADGAPGPKVPDGTRRLERPGAGPPPEGPPAAPPPAAPPGGASPGGTKRLVKPGGGLTGKLVQAQFAPESGEAAALRFLVSFNKAIRLARLYPMGHPLLKDGLVESFGLYVKMAEKLPRLTIGARGGDLYLGNVAVRDVSIGVSQLFGLFSDRGVESLILSHGADEPELVGFIRLFATRNPEAHPDLPYREWGQVPHFRVNDIAYKMVAGDEAIVDKAAAGESAGDASLLGHLTADQAFAGTAEGKELMRLLQTNPGSVATLIKRAVEDMVRTQGAETARPTLAKCVENISADLASRQDGVTFEDLRDRLTRVLFYLPPDFLQGLFGKDMKELREEDYAKLFTGFSAELRAALLEGDLRRDASPELLSKRLGTMAAGEDELVKLSELVAKRLRDRGLSWEECEAHVASMAHALGEERVRRLAEEVPAAEAADVKGLFRAKALVVLLDPDAEVLAAYQKFLASEGYRTLAFSDGALALKAAREQTADMMVLELKLPGMHGLDVIRSLTSDGPKIPLVIATFHDKFREEFEVRTYPRQKFLKKPFQPPDLLAAVSSFTPQATRALIREHVEGRSQNTADLDRAREIQEKLLPDSVPAIEGYDIGAFYRASREVGGDYYDVLPLGDGTYGIAIADVSGKGVSGAMGMVMMRGILRMAAHWCRSAQEALVRVNRYLSKELPHGMFVTAVYAILDPAKRTLTYSLAGHNPPVLYRKGTRRAELLPPSGTPLGLVPIPKFEEVIREATLELTPQDRIVFYTDGVVEALNPAEEVFGEERLIGLVRDASFLDSKKLLDYVVTEVEKHQDTAPQSDDITMVTVKAL
ncbi:MAG: PP2C family protein-serine/threonine phosphatase [Planctomycetales bacterium]|nr:PP2C family protein-serine/threonine phosphatase [Planctomycetales bacterium]